MTGVSGLLFGVVRAAHACDLTLRVRRGLVHLGARLRALMQRVRPKARRAVTGAFWDQRGRAKEIVAPAGRIRQAVECAHVLWILDQRWPSCDTPRSRFEYHHPKKSSTKMTSAQPVDPPVRVFVKEGERANA